MPYSMGYRSINGRCPTVLSGMTIRTLRKSHKWTLDVMSTKAGINLQTLQEIETGNTTPLLSTVVAIAEVLETTVDELLVKIPKKALAKDGLPMEPV